MVHGMAVATAVLTTSGSLVEVNESAEPLFDDRPDGGRSGLSLEELGRATRVFVASARPTGHVNLPDRHGRPAYFARLVAFRAEGTRLSSIEREYAGVPGELVLAFIGVIGSADPRIVRPLAETLGLTSAETDLVELLVNGSSLAQAAQRLGRARNTVRNQLASAMSKANVRRQADLVRMFANAGPA
jgi:DNA-binding CsgD family transcriptional regulator